MKVYKEIIFFILNYKSGPIILVDETIEELAPSTKIWLVVVDFMKQTAILIATTFHCLVNLEQIEIKPESFDCYTTIYMTFNRYDTSDPSKAFWSIFQELNNSNIYANNIMLQSVRKRKGLVEKHSSSWESGRPFHTLQTWEITITHRNSSKGLDQMLHQLNNFAGST